MSAVDAEEIARTVATCPAVADMSAGPTGAVATYLPGRRVIGVRVHRGRVEIHVVGEWGVPIPRLVSEVRASLAQLVHGHDVDIVVEDLGEPAPTVSKPARS
jgi:hypothetical protein